jgi:membrane-associated protease RseP (regulator of RpoE activity)
LLYAVGVLVFALGLLASIALHEVGHMVPAKRFGVKVTQYMVGFGPTIWSKHKGDTEYGLKAIPLGGYIRMIGMVPPRKDGKVSRWPTRLATSIEEFRETSRREVSPGDEDRQFYRLTPGKKMIVMLGGPSMNFVIYLVLTVALALTLGQKKQDVTTTVSSVSKCVVKATEATSLSSDTCPASAVTAPAFNRLQPGDELVAIDGVNIASWQDAVHTIEDSPNKPVALTIKRSGVVQTVTVTPVENEKYANAEGTKTKIAGFIGVAPRLHTYYAATPITQIPGQIGDQISSGLKVLGDYPHRVATVWHTVFDGAKRDPQGAVGVVGIGRIGGEVAASTQFDLQDKIFILISLLANVNLLLCFFNLLPLLPLDGGHVAGALLEAAKRGRARLADRHSRRAGAADGSERVPRPPIYVDAAQMLPVVYAVAAILIAVTALIMYADVVKPVSLGG